MCGCPKAAFFLEGSISIFIHPYPVQLPHPIPLLLSPHPHSLLPLTLRCHILCSFPVLPPYLFPLSFSCSLLPFPILFSSHSIGSCWSELPGSGPLPVGLGGPSLWLLAQPEIHSLAASWLKKKEIVMYKTTTTIRIQLLVLLQLLTINR